jgi:hypothetical protein
MREKKPGVWEVRVFTETDERGKPTQTSGRLSEPCRARWRDGQARSMLCLVARSASIDSSGMAELVADARTMATAACSA